MNNSEKKQENVMLRTGLDTTCSVDDVRERNCVEAVLHAFLHSAVETAFVAAALGLVDVGDDGLSVEILKRSMQFQLVHDLGSIVEPYIASQRSGEALSPALCRQHRDALALLCAATSLSDFFTSLNLRHVYRAHIVNLAMAALDPVDVLERLRAVLPGDVERTFYALLDRADEDFADEDFADEELADGELADGELADGELDKDGPNGDRPDEEEDRPDEDRPHEDRPDRSPREDRPDEDRPDGDRPDEEERHSSDDVDENEEEEDDEQDDAEDGGVAEKWQKRRRTCFKRRR